MKAAIKRVLDKIESGEIALGKNSIARDVKCTKDQKAKPFVNDLTARQYRNGRKSQFSNMKRSSQS